MNSRLHQILHTQDVNSLKSLGAYRELKYFIEEEMRLKLGGKSWDSLFIKITGIRSFFLNDKKDFFSDIEMMSFSEAKKKIENTTEVIFSAKNNKEIKEILDNISLLFNEVKFNPYKRYEETKIKNFKSSSKLEGIYINSNYNDDSLESVIARYKR
ncbi:hypothetical protein MRO89_05485 [Dickeya dianthicola]|uniref:hypothetical protein n=1 Tax=Dickeya dianthicola TaxID=204039 RepID=UPI001F618834|nr:hypothetical protein [Dickeya dianthicola]MCI4185419.1 hypothetical protein [Dickeya dianthicola]